MNKKEENARMLDPQRFQVTKNMPFVPGGPDNNNPMNVTDNSSPPIQAASIYGDFQQAYGQMGTGMVNPMNVQHSGLPQNKPMMQKLNAGQPFNMQMQPDTSGVSMQPDGMESGRLAANAQKFGLNPGPMGMTGMPAQPAPGAFPSDFPGSTGPQLMPGMQSAEQAAGGMAPQNSMNPMTPGSTPMKQGKPNKSRRA